MVNSPDHGASLLIF